MSLTFTSAEPRRSFGFNGRRCGADAESILSEICARSNFTPAQIRSHNHAANVARQEVMWALDETGLYSYLEIGRFLNRHHTTVMHGARRHAERIGSGG